MNGKRLSSTLALAISLVALVLCQGCEKKEHPETPNPVVNLAAAEEVSNTTEPYWVHQANPTARIAVVFVHGLFGSTTSTWNNKDGTGFFKFLHEQPGVGSRVDIFAFGFTSNMLAGGSLDIREAANKLEESLKFHEVWDYENVVFVAHSMGGLVTLRELIAHPERRENVPLVVLYATPARGADVTNIAQLFVRNPAVAQMFPADRNALLQQLSDDWGLISADNKPTVICAYEKAETGPVMIVPWSSAVAFCNGAPSAIGGADHIGIVKPTTPTHDSMVVLVNALRDYVLSKSDTAFLETPDFASEDGACVMRLLDPNGRTPARLVNKGPRGMTYTISNVSDSALVVLPDPTPRTVPPRNQEDLKVLLARGGDLKDEYQFTITTPVMGARLVKVRLGDRQAIHAAQAEVAGAVAEQLNRYLSSPETVQLLQNANEDQRVDAITKAAKEGLANKLPGLPANAEWFMTADVLASAGWSQYARKALSNVQIDPVGSATNAAAVKRLDNVIVRQSEYRVPAPGVKMPISEQEMLRVKPAPSLIDASNAQDWKRLSESMQEVPSLRAEGLSLKGDLLRQEGADRAAVDVYRQAIQIKSNPALKAKVQAAGSNP